MKVYDMINKQELDLTRKELVAMMQHDRQIDIDFEEPRTDDDGYLTWDAENWSSVDNRRFIRCYSLKGRVLRDSTTHNIYDLDNDFKPEEGKQIRLN